jgi:hypothetical protein
MKQGLGAIAIVSGMITLIPAVTYAQQPGAAPGGRGGGRGGLLAHDPRNDNRSFDKHDISGIWTRNGTPGGYGGGGTCSDCGDRGFGVNVPELTPLGQKMFDANKPSYGRNLGSADAAAHPEEPIGRRRAVPPASGSDPYQTCNPMGPSRALIYPDPLEISVLPDRIYQQFEWGYAVRTIWTDGRKLPQDPDLPRWWGYSVGKWEGDTFVVDTVGVDERTWVDHYGYPHSDAMNLQERYTRTAYDVLELNMIITDPKVYKSPWKSELKKFRKLPKDGIKTVDGWTGLLEDVCAPIDEVEAFNKRIRDPAGGVVH